MTSTPGVDVATRLGAAVRGEFPIFESATYLNSCSQGALSHRVREAVEGWLAGWDANGAEWDFWVERNEAFRTAVAGLLHAGADDVAVTTSVSQGVSALVSALPLDGERNRIVISEYEFPTVGQIAHAQELRGAEVVHVRPGPDGSIGAERFAEAIDERTALVCCTTVSYRSGHRHDVAAIAAAAHEAGALVLADSYQACGAVELDVGALGADVVTGGTVKYLLGTAGLGFMWVRPELHRSLLPTQTGWFADEDIFAMSIADYSPHASARRFDSGTPPVPALYAGVAGLELAGRDRRGGRRGARPRSRRAPLRRARRARGDRRDAARAGRPRPPRLRPVDRRPVARRRPRRGADRHLDARREPAGRLPPLQRRGRRRPAPRGVAPSPRAARLTSWRSREAVAGALHRLRRLKPSGLGPSATLLVCPVPIHPAHGSSGQRAMLTGEVAIQSAVPRKRRSR